MFRSTNVNAPGYALESLQAKPHGLTAQLNLASGRCNAFSKDIANLTIEVTYETQSRYNTSSSIDYGDNTDAYQTF